MIDPESAASNTTKNQSDVSQNQNEEVSSTATGFLTHLIELRDRLLRAVLVVGVAFVVLFPFAKNIYNWLAAPLVNQGQEMLIIGPIAPFLVPMKLTLLVAFLIALPYLFYQMWAFVAPGLYKHEKRLIYPLLASSIFLFYLGILFVYYILLPMMFKIIPQFAPDIAVYSPDIAQYLDFTMMMFMAFGFGFEMPIATIILISTGMTTAEKLKEKRPYIIVGAFVLGMLLTPPDVVSQIMLAIPMWLLFELGLIFSKFFDVRIKEASDAKEAMDKQADASDDTTAVISADTLWEDDNYIFEEADENNDSHSADDDIDDADKTILNKDQLNDNDLLDDDDSSKSEDESNNANENETFFDNPDFDELSDEEMDAELDRIEALEKAEKKIKKKAKKRAKKKQKAQNKKTGKDKKPKK